jgi:hypothetical protein
MNLTFEQYITLYEKATEFTVNHMHDPFTGPELRAKLPDDLFLDMWPCSQLNEVDYVLTVRTSNNDQVATYSTRKGYEIAQLETIWNTHYNDALALTREREIELHGNADTQRKLRVARAERALEKLL